MSFLKKTSFVVTLSTLLTTLPSFAQENSSVSLLAAVRIALKENPKIRSNDKILEAMLLRVQSLKRSQLPGLSVSASTGYDRSTISSGGEVTPGYDTAYRSAGVNLNWTIFDGGAKRKRIQSAECSFKERQASFNSTNTLTRNTQGQIASLVVENYVSLVGARENIQFTEQVLQILTKFRSAAKTQGEIIETENSINSMTLSLEQLKADETKAANNYEYVVTQQAPKDIESFQQMIDSLVVPPNPQEAMRIALEKSPEIKTARYQIECNRLRYQSAKASAYSPKVDVSVGYNQSNQNLDGSAYNSRGASIGISLRMNLDPGASSELAAQRKEIDSSTDNLDGAIADAKHDLETDYPDLQNSIRFAELHNKNYLNNYTNVMQYVSDIDAHKKVSVSDAMKELSSMIGSWYSHSREVSRVLNKKFQIQKNVGTLFENLGFKEFGVSDIQLN